MDTQVAAVGWCLHQHHADCRAYSFIFIVCLAQPLQHRLIQVLQLRKTNLNRHCLMNSRLFQPAARFIPSNLSARSIRSLVVARTRTNVRFGVSNET